MKRNVYLSQVNNLFGRSAFLPYSAGLLQAYAQNIPEIREAYEFKGFVFLREPIMDVVARVERPDVFGASCYIWNWEYSKHLCQAIKAAHPDCLIVLGGPHVPVHSEGFFQDNPWADLLIHYEGEVTFAEVLLRRIHKEEYFRDDFGEIKGLSINAGPATIVTPPRERIDDLDRIPSPYLTGVFDDLILQPYDFHASQETHRGCLALGSIIETEEGPKPIEKILLGERVLGWDEEENRLIWNEIDRPLYTGKKEVLRITTGEGNVEATSDHPIYTKRGWRPAGEVREGDQVLCRVWKTGGRFAEPDVLLCLRSSFESGEDGCDYSSQESEKNPSALYDVQGKARAVREKDLLLGVRSGGEEGMAGEETQEAKTLLPSMRQKDSSPPGRDVWKCSEDLQCSLREQTDKCWEEGEPQSCQETGSSEENIGHRQEDGSGTLGENNGSSPSRKDQLLPSSGVRPEQVRAESYRVHRETRATVSVRRHGGLLDRPRSQRDETESRLYSSPSEAQDSRFGSRNLLAYQRPGRTSSIDGGLPGPWVEGVRDLGECPSERSNGREDQGFCWSVVRSIEPVGIRRVYDLTNARPFPNFFANGILVHNCPYSCSFCDWGSNTLAKVKAFSTERLVEEFEWMGKHKIDLLYNCDANYAMLPRDGELTERMVQVKNKYGYPNKFRAAYAKNSNEKVFNISKRLNEAGMSKGTTLSFQSMDDNTLQIVKRKNIKVNDFKNLMQRYREADIPTYTELIIGLPGESYDSFANGIDTLLLAGAHGSLQVYTCEVLPNSEMGHPEYRKVHEIKTARTPVLHFHATPSTDPYPEFYELVVATKTLPEEDWMWCQLFAWAVQSFHCLGLTQSIAVFLHHYKGVSYREFYEGLLDFACGNPQYRIGQAYTNARVSFWNLWAGKSWGFYDPKFGDIIWPVEEGGFLSCVEARARFLLEISVWIQDTFGLDTSLLCDLLAYQDAVVRAPGQKARQSLLLRYNLHEYLEGCYLQAGPSLMREDHRYEIRATEYTDLSTYAKEVVWYGRKGGKFKNEVVSLALKEGTP